jgi:hypothetical protein
MASTLTDKPEQKAGFEELAILSEARAGRPVFQCGDRIFTVGDVVAAAVAMGRLASFRTAWLSTHARVAQAEATGCQVDPAAIEQATDAFRYDRDLVSAEECERWLAQLGLCFEDLVACFTRRLVAASAADAAGAADAQTGALDEGSKEAFEVDLLLNDDFAGWARALAERVAAAQANGTAWKAEDDLGARWDELESVHREICAGLTGTAERERLLRQDWMALTLLELEVVTFDNGAATREAECCVRHDGGTLAEVGEQNGLCCETVSAFLADLQPPWRSALTVARAGDVALLPSADTGFAVVRVLSRSEPSLESERVCRRLDARLRGRHFRALESRHIRWIVMLEPVA